MIKKFFSMFICISMLLCFSFGVLSHATSFTIDFEPQSKAITLMNLDTGVTIFEKNADEKVFPASVTKIMTYIVASENIFDLDGTNITVSDALIDSLQGTDSSLSDIKRGETLSAYELLNCMMIPSGNDAASVLADYVGGGDISKFVNMMNTKAQELGCTNTHFVNPTGLHDPEHYTTSNDMCKITKYAMQLPRFMQIVSQTEHKLPATNKQGERTLYTTNKMMLPYYTDYYYKYTNGIKTGWHDDAGNCIVSSATADGYTYVCVAMGSPSKDAQGKELDNGAMLDSKKLYRWALTTFETKQVLDAQNPIDEIDLKLAWGKDSLLLVPERNVSYVLPKDIKSTSISVVTTEKPEYVNAPVKKGDVLGKAKLTYANQELTEVNLVASEDVSRSDLLYYLEIFKNILSSPWFIIATVSLAMLIVIYIIIARIYNKKNKNKRRVKHYRNL